VSFSLGAPPGFLLPARFLTPPGFPRSPRLRFPAPLGLDPPALLLDAMPLRLGTLPLPLGMPALLFMQVGVAPALIVMPGLGVRRGRQGRDGEDGGEQGTTSHDGLLSTEVDEEAVRMAFLWHYHGVHWAGTRRCGRDHACRQRSQRHAA
jgi:hypothetical protein